MRHIPSPERDWFLYPRGVPKMLLYLFSVCLYLRVLYPGHLIGYHTTTSSMTVSHWTVHPLMTANFIGGYSTHPQGRIMVLFCTTLGIGFLYFL